MGDLYTHKPLADDLHELFGLSCAGASMEHSYSDLYYLSVAAHGGVDIEADQCLTAWGWLWRNRYRLSIDTEESGCIHMLCLQKVRQSTLFLSCFAC